MLTTFVIALREGLEASLIVGIIAAFLGQQGRKDALRQVWIGTAAAVAICIGVAIALQEPGQRDRKSTRLNSSHPQLSRMPSSA